MRSPKSISIPKVQFRVRSLEINSAISTYFNSKGPIQSRQFAATAAAAATFQFQRSNSEHEVPQRERFGICISIPKVQFRVGDLARLATPAGDFNSKGPIQSANGLLHRPHPSEFQFQRSNSETELQNATTPDREISIPKVQFRDETLSKAEQQTAFQFQRSNSESLAAKRAVERGEISIPKVQFRGNLERTLRDLYRISIPKVQFRVSLAGAVLVGSVHFNSKGPIQSRR